MRPIELKRTVPVHVFETVASIAVPEARPDLLAVVHLVGARGEATGRDVGRDLLGMDAGLGWRVLERCQRLELVTREQNSGPYRLTELGHRALADEQILLPERSAYAFYWIDDPLLPEVVLGWRAMATESPHDRLALDKETRDLAKDAKAGRGPARAACPRQLAGLLGVPTAALHDGGLVRLLELGEGFADTAGSVELILTLCADQEPTLRLHGQVDSQRIDRSLEVGDRVEHTHGTLWRHLVRNAVNVPDERLEEWEARFGIGTVGRSFSELGDAARRAFEERLTVRNVELDHAGRFDGTSLTVAIAPESDDDAHQWADWLVWDGLHDHHARHELEAHLTAVTQRFPHHRVELPVPGVFLQDARRRLRDDHRAWRLVAPGDLGLWEVTHG